jgi:putative alpha-1,2-mannosidase
VFLLVVSFSRQATTERPLLALVQLLAIAPVTVCHSILRTFNMTRWLHHFFVLLLTTITVAFVTAIDHPEDYVNLLAGTFTDGNVFSTGNTLPLIGRPWGFNHWAPQTRDGNRNTGSWWFRGNDHVLTWFRCTHQPSPWIGDWGWFLFAPQVGNHGDRNPTMFWEPRAAIIKPHLFDAIFRYYCNITTN